MKNILKFIPPHTLKTAVLFLVFNRLETTKKVFESIRKAKPRKLYVASDGPRNLIESDILKIEKVRKYILENIDWKCEVKTFFRKKNLGCKVAVSEAITWFYENEEMGIILEDDCLPSQSFFWFCEQLLKKYKHDKRIWHISGSCPLNKNIEKNKASYYFSKLNHIWGWATWSDRWKNYDINISRLDDFIKQDIISNVTSDKLSKEFWINNFISVKSNKIDTWDYQWYFAIWLNNGLSILSTKNMITNLGFGDDALHTKDKHHKLSNLKSYEIEFPLTNPDLFIVNNLYDKLESKYIFDLSLKKYYFSKIKKFIIR